MFELDVRFASVRELMEFDANQPLGEDEFDTQLWLLLTPRLHEPKNLSGLPTEIGVYFASRLLQFEVCDGGFAQAASDVAEWLELAANGYEALGRPMSAALIRQAMKVASNREGRADVTDSALDQLTLQVVTDDWEIDAQRVQYVREHRAQFASMD